MNIKNQELRDIVKDLFKEAALKKLAGYKLASTILKSK